MKFRTIRNLIWNTYKGFCFFAGTLVILIFAFGSVVQILKEFDRTYLPNGIYIAKGSLFTGKQDIQLWRPDGTSLYDAGLNQICFSDKFIEATIYIRKNVSSFYYSVEEDQIATNIEKEEYSRMKNASEFYKHGPICNGYTKDKMLVSILLKNPWLLNEKYKNPDYGL